MVEVPSLAETDSGKSASGAMMRNAQIQELLFFAYRDFTADADSILEKYGFGRAHHRVLHFVGRSSGLTVADLLELLGITKQSLARVLKQLIDAHHIEQKTNARDRRQRELYLTENGEALVAALSLPQHRRIERALEQAGPQHRGAIVAFLQGMIDEIGRHALAGLEDDRSDHQGVQRDDHA